MPNPDSAAVRKWAREHGLVSTDRGRLPRAVLEAYAAAHGPSYPDPPAPRQTTLRRTPAAKVPASSASIPAAEDPGDTRLRAVEAQLAQALTRIDALERRATRSVLGLRLSL